MTMFLAALVGSAMVCLFIVRNPDWHLHITGDEPDMQPQKFHTAAVPRVGGVGIMLGLLIAGVVGVLRGFGTADFYWVMLIALIPAFAGGLAEDLTRRVGAMIRLLMTAVAAAIAFIWLDAGLYRSDVEWLDAAFRYWPISFAATLFAVAGVAHAMNLIDGYNGLSAGVGVITLLALGIVCARVGDKELASVSFVAAGAAAGFLMFNYPFGKIFLGDGGAYLIGATIAIVSACLVGRHTDVSPWFPFVLVVYPVWETLFSALRRLILHRTHIGHPDARHLHSLIYRRVMRAVVPGRDDVSLTVRNAWTSLPLWLVQIALVMVAVRYYQSTAALVTASYGFVALYCVAYFWLGRIRRPIPVRIQRYLAERQIRVEQRSGA